MERICPDYHLRLTVMETKWLKARLDCCHAPDNRPSTLPVWLTGHTKSHRPSQRVGVGCHSATHHQRQPTQHGLTVAATTALDPSPLGWNYLQDRGVQSGSHLEWPGPRRPMARLLTSGTRTITTTRSGISREGQRLLFGVNVEQRKIHGGFGRSGKRPARCRRGSVERTQFNQQWSFQAP